MCSAGNGLAIEGEQQAHPDLHLCGHIFDLIRRSVTKDITQGITKDDAELMKEAAARLGGVSSVDKCAETCQHTREISI